MRTLIRVSLLLSLFSVSGLALAAPAAQLIVNCIPAATPPPGTHCFDHVVGQPFTFWVVAVDSTGAVATGYTGTVHITSSDPKAALPPDHTFNAADAGLFQFPFTFNSVTTGNVPSPETITATDSAGALIGAGAFFVSLPAIATPALNAISLSLLAALLGVAGFHSFRRTRP